MIRKLLRFFAVFCLSLIILFLTFFAISIRCVDDRPFRETDYFQKTVTALSEKIKSTPPSSKNPLFVGAAKAGLTPPIGLPLAGYGERHGAASLGVHDSLYVRVIALKSGDQQVFIVGYDALLLHPPVRQKLEIKMKDQLNINPEQVLYTATHTHSGPGGWGTGWVEEQFAGPPDERVSRIFIDSTIVAMKRATRNQQAATYRAGSVQAPRFIRNRLVGEKGDVDAELVYLLFENNGQALACFTTFSAHATVLSAKNKLFSGDYPGYLLRKLESQLGGVALFAAAGLGSHSYRGEGEKFEKAKFIGEGLADSIICNLSKSKRSEEAALSFLRIPFCPARMQVRLTEKITLAPWLATKLLKAYDTYIQFLAIDDFIICGCPGEFSGELALDVKQEAARLGKKVTITSFNGCYIGYLTPSKYYSMNEYETRLMSWFGPYTGDYVTEIVKICIARI